MEIDKNAKMDEEELIKTIKMEPILETTEMPEEENLTKKKKRIRIVDILLIIFIIILLGLFITVLTKVKM